VSTYRRAIDRIFHGGRAPCCGATNGCCSLPPGLVRDYGTGCEKCGHPAGCHAYMWRST